VLKVEDRIVFEDNHLIVVNKLAGELVQGDFTGDEPLVELVRNYIKVKYNKPGNVFCGLVHRLDRPTSGMVIFTKTSKALTRMNKLFETRSLEKRYYAVVAERPPENLTRLEHWLRKDSTKNKSFVVKPETQNAKKAQLEYKLAAVSQKYFLLEVNLMTGRHHQIRVQLAKEGNPIKGDLKYGYPRSNHDASISLHAGKISFVHPITKEMINLTAACPGEDAIWRVFNSIITE
jgi:23S rRNA pseudouridine1911/1915/1917 synthase